MTPLSDIAHREWMHWTGVQDRSRIGSPEYRQATRRADYWLNEINELTDAQAASERNAA